MDMAKHIDALEKGEDGLRGGDFLEPGKYRFLIQDAERRSTKMGDDFWGLTLEVIASDKQGHEGKELKQMFFCKDGEYEGNEARLILLALATGLTTLEELQALARAGKPWTPDFGQAVGREFVCELSKQKESDFLRVKGKRIWSVTDESAKDVPGCGPGATPASGASEAGKSLAEAF